MGMCARLIGIGLFSQDVSEQLDYPASHFAKTRSGAPVITLWDRRGFYGQPGVRIDARHL